MGILEVLFLVVVTVPMLACFLAGFVMPDLGEDMEERSS